MKAFHGEENCVSVGASEFPSFADSSNDFEDTSSETWLLNGSSDDHRTHGWNHGNHLHHRDGDHGHGRHHASDRAHAHHQSAESHSSSWGRFTTMVPSFTSPPSPPARRSSQQASAIKWKGSARSPWGRNRDAHDEDEVIELVNYDDPNVLRKMNRPQDGVEEPFDDGGDIVVFELKSKAERRMEEEAAEEEELTGEEERVVDDGPFILAAQAIPSLLLAGMGLFLAGWLLDFVQYSDVFLGVPEMFILVPVLLGLKGNLEMNLASRLSTAAGLGRLQKPKSRNKVILGNLVLLQVQATVVGAFSGMHAIFLGGLSHNTWSSFQVSLLVVTSSVLTACLASLLLGSVMCGLVLLCYRYKINPANVAAPMASSMGDLLTLCLMWLTGNFLYKNLDTVYIPVISISLLVLLPMWTYITWKNVHVKHVLIHGWLSLMVAMMISSAAGIILEAYVRRYPSLALLVPVMNGLGGNISAIFASRRSTFLHAEVNENPTKSQLTLFSLITPLLLGFLLCVELFNLGDIDMSLVFICTIVLVGMSQVGLLLMIARGLVELLWSYKLDPDDYALPLLAAMGDLIGTGLLVQAFQILTRLGYMTEEIPDDVPQTRSFVYF